jgi:hypothetical protein
MNSSDEYYYVHELLVAVRWADEAKSSIKEILGISREAV